MDYGWVIENPKSKMRRQGVVYVGSYQRAGRLLPRRAAGLRAGVVVLRPGEVMPWHSTKSREELLVALRGSLRVEVRRSRRMRQMSLKSGHCLLLPRQTLHCVVNRSRKNAQYIYVTGVLER